jgi:hypothetical protein
VLGVLAEPPQIARFRSLIRTEEVDHDEPNHIRSQWRRNCRELRNWARGCYSTEAAVEVLIRARSWEIRGPCSAMAADRRPSNHLARRTSHRAVRACRVLRRAPHSGTRRGPRTRQAARRCGRAHGQLWTPTISISSLPSGGILAVAAGQHVILRRLRRRVLGMTDDGRDRFPMLTPMAGRPRSPPG